MLNACMYRKRVTLYSTSQGQLAAAIHLQSRLAPVAQPALVQSILQELATLYSTYSVHPSSKAKHEQAAAIVTDITAAANKYSCLGSNINTCATQ